MNKEKNQEQEIENTLNKLKQYNPDIEFLGQIGTLQEFLEDGEIDEEVEVYDVDGNYIQSYSKIEILKRYNLLEKE